MSKFVDIGVIVLTCISSHSLYSQASPEEVRGMGPECAYGYINYDLPILDCMHPHGNDCSAQGCVNNNGTCDDGKRYSGNMPHEYEMWAVGSCDEELRQDTTVACTIDVICTTGALQADKFCTAVTGPGSCKVPEFVPPTGCKTCTIGSEDVLTLVSKVDPYYRPCPCQDQE